MAGDGFLLGHIIDPATGDKTGTDVAYDRSDLTTHGVIVGMTGSGKTGLGIILLEVRSVPACRRSSSTRRATWGISSCCFPTLRPETSSRG